MAGFGTLGGGSSFPQRIGTPESQKILTNQEWDDDWQKRLGSISPTAGGTRVQLDLVPGSAGYNANSARPYHQQIQQSMQGGSASGGWGNSIYASPSAGSGGSHLVNDWWVKDRQENPEYAAAVAEYQNEGRLRHEGQLRQQQSYGSMQGNNQLDGVIGPDYTAPQFGQVSGQEPTQIPNIPGVDMGWTQSLGTQNGDGSFGAAQGQTGIFGNPTPQNKRWGL